MTIKVYNAAAVPKLVKKIAVYNSAGAPKNVKNVWVYNTSGVPQKVFTYASVPPFLAFNSSMTAGKLSTAAIYGWSDGSIHPAFGTLTPNPTYVNGDGIAKFVECSSFGADLSFMVAMGPFSADPGRLYFTQIDTKAPSLGIKTTATCDGYSFSGGYARWYWDDSGDFTQGGNYQLIVT